MSFDATAVIRQESERFAAVLAAVSADQKVPSCPDWTAADLLWHLTEVHEFWAGVLTGPATTQDQAMALEEGAVPRPAENDALPARRAAATEALLAQLSSRQDEETAWFWYSAQQNVGVTRRMQTHEATIHRVDAELAAGRPVTRIAENVAHAGLDHVLSVMWPAMFEWIPEWAELRPVAVATITADAGRTRELLISRWSGTRPRDGKEFDVPVGRLLGNPAEAEGLPRVAVHGSANALDLWAWGRALALDALAGGPEKVEIIGDAQAVAQIEALINQGHD